MFFHNWPGETDVHTVIGDTCVLCGRRLVLAMIPPALGKSFDEFPKINALWALAFRKLCEADRWIIIGVSLADSDYYLRALLREARAARDTLILDVANPCEEHRKKVIRLLRADQANECQDLQKWLDKNKA